MKITVTMKFIQMHKVLAEYREVDEKGHVVAKYTVGPMYLRQSQLKGGELPKGFIVNLTSVEK